MAGSEAGSPTMGMSREPTVPNSPISVVETVAPLPEYSCPTFGVKHAGAIVGAMQFVLHTLRPELECAVGEHPPTCSVSDCLTCLVRGLLRLHHRQGCSATLESQAQVHFYDIVRIITPMEDSDQPIIALSHLLVALRIPRRNMKVTETCEHCNWNACTVRNSGIFETAQQRGSGEPWDLSVANEPEPSRCPNCRSKKFKREHVSQPSSVFCIRLEDASDVPPWLEYCGSVLTLTGIFDECAAESFGWAFRYHPNKQSKRLLLRRDGNVNVELFGAEGVSTVGPAFAVFRVFNKVIRDAIHETVEGKRDVVDVVPRIALKDALILGQHKKLAFELLLRQLVDPSTKFGNSMIEHGKHLKTEKGVDPDEALKLNVFRENPSLMEQLGVTQPSAFHFNLICEHPTAGKHLWRHMRNPDHIEGHVQYLANRMIQFLGSVDAEAVLTAVPVPASFTVQTFSLSFGLNVFQARLLDCAIFEFIVEVAKKKDNRKRSGAIRLCTQLVEIPQRSDSRFEMPVLVKPIASKLPGWWSTGVSPSTGGADVPPNTVYGLGVASFVSIHGWKSLAWTEGSDIKGTRKELGSKEQERQAAYHEIGRAHGKKEKEKADAVHSEKRIAVDEQEVKLRSEVSVSKALFADHKAFLDCMEKTSEVREAYARLPHPKLCVSTLFMMALILLAVVSVAVVNPPRLQATTRSVERQINSCMEDFRENRKGFMSSMLKWVRRESWVPGEDNGTKTFFQCIPALKRVVFEFCEKIDDLRDNDRIMEMDIAFDSVQINGWENVSMAPGPASTSSILVRNRTALDLSFPRALYFSSTVNERNPNTPQMSKDARNRVTVATEVLLDFNAEIEKFSHRIVPVGCSSKEPFVGVDLTNESGWRSALGIAAAMMSVAAVVHIISDVVFLIWTRNTPAELSVAEIGTRALIIMVEVLCIVFTAIAAVNVSSILDDNTPQQLDWFGYEVTRVQRAGLLLRICMILCLSPIAHGARYCGNVFLSAGTSVLSAFCCIISMIVFVFKDDITVAEVVYNTWIQSNTILLAAGIVSVTVAHQSRGKMQLETKHFSVYRPWRPNYDLKFTFWTGAVVFLTVIVQVAVILCAVFFGFWDNISLKKDAHTERFNILRSDPTGFLPIIESFVAIAAPIGVVAVNWLSAP